LETIKKNHSVPNRLFLGILIFICAALQLTVFTSATANLKESVAGKTRVEDPFDHIKQVKAGVFDIGYVEAGPASGEVVLGSIGNGTNPEQLFAAGWSACFIGAMQHNAALAKIKLPKGTAVDAEVDLGTGEKVLPCRPGCGLIYQVSPLKKQLVLQKPPIRPVLIQKLAEITST
jgi:hypothetical protein